MKFIIRDFRTEQLAEYERFLDMLAAGCGRKVPEARGMSPRVLEQYRNMREVLEKHPQVIDYAIEAMERFGITPKRDIIRGGTDGARLCFMGLPTPNIFDGAHNYHSPLEWVAVQDMELAVKTIVEIAKIWEEKS